MLAVSSGGRKKTESSLIGVKSFTQLVRRCIGASVVGEQKQRCVGEQKQRCVDEQKQSLLVASLSLAQPLKHSHRRQKLSPSKEDPWPPDRSLSTVVSLHQISRCRRLVAADLAEQNAEVLRESEGEEASAVTEEEVSGLEVSEGNLLLYSV
ncbi:uncharacterized protein G2W53_014864 [Senna tora]|uniref:Uncharacterized protein n=1 Tax=Senna tora TaxID=362788 RepID=A0A835C737_9FABA|nr:uncharacterized protein G2W53_014864 [Senna tora]